MAATEDSYTTGGWSCSMNDFTIFTAARNSRNAGIRQLLLTNYFQLIPLILHTAMYQFLVIVMQTIRDNTVCQNKLNEGCLQVEESVHLKASVICAPGVVATSLALVIVTSTSKNVTRVQKQLNIV